MHKRPSYYAWSCSSCKEGVTLGHEFVGVVTVLGKNVKNLKVGDRVSANCITFCGECRFCKRGFINNCIKGGWEIGCKIDGCQAEYVRVPFAQTGLTKLPDNVSDENALLSEIFYQAVISVQNYAI